MRYANQRKKPRCLLPSGHHLWVTTVSKFIHMSNLPSTLKESLLLKVQSNQILLACKEAESYVPQCGDASSYYEAIQIVALMKKYEGVSSKSQLVDPERVARDTWLAAEELCRTTNEALYDPSPEMLWKLGRAKAYVLSVLGHAPDMERIYARCDFSTGASLGVHGDRTNRGRKFTSPRWSCTSSALSLALAALSRTRYTARGPLQSELDGSPLKGSDDIISEKLEVVRGNKVAYVPKTMATHRAIAVEPILNSFVQSGIDLEMRDLLDRNGGINLRYQGPNQELARIGSIDGSYATIDLSSASDTMCRMLVKRLLPYDWWSLLNATRSPYSLQDKTWVELEKFCSMGNNFCFPLETIIFASICYASGAPRGSFRVYGDDIVIKSQYAKATLELLVEFGFRPNPEKTFVDGPFRESCGADWWSGIPVRPVYCRKSWRDVRNLMSFHNIALSKWKESWSPLLKDLRDSVDRNQRFLRPHFEPNGDAFNAPLEECMASPYVSWDRSVFNWKWTEFCSLPIADSLPDSHETRFVTYLAILQGASSEMPFSLRRQTRTSTRIVSRWPSREISMTATLSPYRVSG